MGCSSKDVRLVSSKVGRMEPVMVEEMADPMVETMVGMMDTYLAEK